MEAKLTWKENMQFECSNGEHSSLIDAFAEHGGEGTGPTPKELLLNAMMGCTAMDTISILKKMRQNVESFTIHIDAEKSTEHPIHFTSATLIFSLTGEINPEKVIKAATKSLTQYCGVNYMVSKTCDITFEITLNGEKIHRGQSDFCLINNPPFL